MRELAITDQSWTLSEEDQVEELDVSADAEFERSLSFTYARI